LECDFYLLERSTAKAKEIAIIEAKRPRKRDGARYQRVPARFVSIRAACFE
jgi:hypothetical protein